jgi:hypothetical protein
MDSSESGTGGQTPGAGLVAARDSSESGAGGQTPGPRGEKRPSEVASEVARDTYFFSDYSPEEWLSMTQTWRKNYAKITTKQKQKQNNAQIYQKFTRNVREIYEKETQNVSKNQK